MPLIPSSNHPVFRLFLMVFLLGGPFGSAQEPEADGWQEKSGFALVKPLAWSQDNLTSVVEFHAFIDRTAKGRKVAGYFVFRTVKTPELQVPSARVVKMVVYPEPLGQLVQKEQRAELQKIIEEYAALGAKYPSVSPLLEKPLAALSADAAKFDAGSVKEGGKWVVRAAFYKKKADDLVALVGMEITGAPKVRALNLSANQYYIGLEEIAGVEPSVKTQLESVRSLYETLRRKEERNELVEKLKAPDVTFENSELFVKTLKTLKPEEDTAVSRFLDEWDRSVERAAKLRERVGVLRVAFEQEMAAKTDTTQPVVVSGDLATRACQITEELKGFPQAIPIPAPLVKAMAVCATSLPDIQKEMEAHGYFEAKSKIGEILNSARLVGPGTAAAVDLLQKKTTAEIEKFEALRDEAKVLQAGGKVKEALIKYREAWAVMPDKDVAARIAALKK